jgi:hypothetical protein
LLPPDTRIPKRIRLLQMRIRKAAVIAFAYHLRIVYHQCSIAQ